MNDESSDESETNSYRVTVTREFELDFFGDEEELMQEQTGADTVSDAIQEALKEREVTHIEPTEKLIGITVNARPSDD